MVESLNDILSASYWSFSIYTDHYQLSSLKLTVRTQKWMVGILFPFRMAYFQGRAVSFREGIPLRKNWRRLFFRMLGLGPGTLHRGHFRPIRPTRPGSWRLMFSLSKCFPNMSCFFSQKTGKKELFILSTSPPTPKKKNKENNGKKTTNQGYWLTTRD